MGNVFIFVALVIIICLMIVGFYFIFTNKTPIGADEGVRIVGSAHSIVSVRKVANTGMYEVKVDDIPMADMYEEGEFLYHEESPLDRWMRTDISNEERRLLHEELKLRYGIDMGWIDNQKEEEDIVERTEEDEQEQEEEVNPDTLMPVGSVNRFNGYNPFDLTSDEDGDDSKVEVLMRFVFDSYMKGLLKPEIVILAQDRYGKKTQGNNETMGVDIERLRREQDLSGAKADPSIADMAFDEFDSFVHNEVASAAVEEAAADILKVENEHPTEINEDTSNVPMGEIYDFEVKEEDMVPAEGIEVKPAPATSGGYDWGDDMDE